MTCREAESLLDARFDGELDVAGSAAIDRHISECRACAAHYAALQQLHEDISSPGVAYTLPVSLEQKLASRFLPERKSPAWFWSKPWGRWFLVAGAACLVAVVLYLPITRTSDTDAIGAEILDSHLRALQPGHLVDVPSSDKHTVKPWFQGKTSFSPPVPDLSDNDFTLVGGRLEVIHRQPAAAIVYRRRQHVISLYVLPSPGADTRPELRDTGGYHLLRWRQDNISYWAVSDVNATDLRDFANLLAGRE